MSFTVTQIDGAYRTFHAELVVRMDKKLGPAPRREKENPSCEVARSFVRNPHVSQWVANLNRKFSRLNSSAPAKMESKIATSDLARRLEIKLGPLRSSAPAK